MERSLSLTEGACHSTMLHFALPFLLANLLQALYGAADLLIVGQFFHAQPSYPLWPRAIKVLCKP